MEVKSFAERRENILGVFNQAKQDLETLNNDIQDQINSNNEEAARIAQENKELTTLQAGNTAAIKLFRKLFGN